MSDSKSQRELDMIEAKKRGLDQWGCIMEQSAFADGAEYGRNEIIRKIRQLNYEYGGISDLRIEKILKEYDKI